MVVGYEELQTVPACLLSRKRCVMKLGHSLHVAVTHNSHRRTGPESRERLGATSSTLTTTTTELVFVRKPRLKHSPRIDTRRPAYRSSISLVERSRTYNRDV